MSACFIYLTPSLRINKRFTYSTLRDENNMNISEITSDFVRSSRSYLVPKKQNFAPREIRLRLVFTSDASTSTSIKQLMLSENERRHKHQNQPRHPPFCSNAQTRGTWDECFNWPDVVNFLVLLLRFVFTRRKRTQA